MPSALCCSVTRVAPLLEHFLGLDCFFHRTCASFPVNSASNPELFSPRRLSSCSLDGSCSAALFRASLLRFSFPALLVSAILARSLPLPFLAPSSTRAHRHGFLSFGLSVCYPSGASVDSAGASFPAPSSTRFRVCSRLLAGAPLLVFLFPDVRSDT